MPTSLQALLAISIVLTVGGLVVFAVSEMGARLASRKAPEISIEIIEDEESNPQ